MIRRIDLRKIEKLPRTVVQRAQVDVDSVISVVKPIIEDIKNNGDKAIMAWTEKLDGVKPASLLVPIEVIDKAFSEMSPDVIEALQEAIRRSQIVHKSQIRKDSTTEVVEGGSVSERWLPVDRVGLYVPGGNAVYPSSVVMNVVPAQVAGVRSIAVASPAQKKIMDGPIKQFWLRANF